MKNNFDESAFPCGPMGDSMTFEDGRTTHQYPAQPGMSLRDWFAGMALQGLSEPQDVGCSAEYYKRIAEKSYQIANEMMEARKTFG